MQENYEALSLRAGRLSRFFAAMAVLVRDSACVVETTDLRKIGAQTWQDDRRVEVCLVKMLVPSMGHKEAIKYMEKSFAGLLEILHRYDLSPRISTGSGIGYKIVVQL